MRKKYRAVVIGAGKIGAQMDSPKSKFILTHAHAYQKHKQFDLIGFIDKNNKRSAREAARWGVEIFSDLDELVDKNIDVVSVAVNDEEHFQVLKQISRYPIQLVIAEKPLATEVKNKQEIQNIFDGKNQQLIVNYSRRFLFEYQNIRKMIRLNRLGKFVGGSGYYGKGLLHYGSHLVNLLTWFFDDVQVRVSVGAIEDFSKSDLTVSAQLLVNKRDFWLMGVDSRRFQAFELDLWFEKGRIRIVNAGDSIEIYKTKVGVVSKGYRSLVLWKTVRPRAQNLMYRVVDHAYGVLEQRSRVLCTAIDAIRSECVCHEILRDYEKNTHLR
ncbi:Gfo/Idh/MocA family protein [Pseudomonadota bacterium]